MEKPRTRCAGCEAPIQFRPGAGSRLCPFCGHTNLVREQRIATPPFELEVDELFRQFQRCLAESLPEDQRSIDLKAALDRANRLLKKGRQNARLGLYRACLLQELGHIDEAIYSLIDLTGLDATRNLRADTHAKLAETLHLGGRTEEALESVNSCLKIMKGHPGASLCRAGILRESGQATQATIILEETLAKLGQDWKITFPPQRCELLLMLAGIHVQEKEAHKAEVPLENLLIQETAAPLQVVAEAARMLGMNYLESRSNREEGMTLIRHAALLDPVNRLGMVDALRIAVVQLKGDVKGELSSLKERRKEILAEIRQVFSMIEDSPLGEVDQLDPQMALTSLDRDPDRRTDLLEGAANRLGLKRFDRGTLYPLGTVEEFRRWVVAWRMRAYLRRMKHEEVEEQRIVKLKAAREATSTRAAFHRQRERLEQKQRLHKQRRTRILRWLGLGMLFLAALVVSLLVWQGDRFLDHFQGRLKRVECTGDSCTLHVATGQAGRTRYQNRTAKASGLSRLLSEWLDGRVQKDGTLLYPLDFPWGDLPAEAYKKCLGKRVSKDRFSFTPSCQ